ncbi:MAG TPA: Ig-like domain-containing protein [Solirubrobacteraceae bacterium]|jgi:hypothetical protein
MRSAAVFRGALLAALAAVAAVAAAAPPALAAGDTTPPTLSVSQPDSGNFTYYQQPRPYFSGGVSDDTTAEPTITITIRDPEGAVAAEEAIGPQSGSWSFNFQQADDPPLTHGVRYDADVVAEDEAGNTTTVATSFVVDGVAPKLAVDPTPEQTTDDTPAISGTSSRDPGDMPQVHVVLTKPNPDGHGEVGVATAEPEVGPDGRWAAELSPAVEPRDDYKLRVTHLDQAMNASVVVRPLRIVPPPPPPPGPAEPTGPPPPPPSVLPTVSSETAATALRQAALRTLRRTAIRGLLRRGAKIVVDAGRPGVATVELLQTTAGGRAAARRVVARGRRATDAAGRTTISLRATAQGRRMLKRARRARLTVRVRFAPTSGSPATLSAPLTLKR